MIARLLEESDIPILNRIAQQNGYEYPDLSKPDIEAAMVVEDASGKIIAAAAAKRISELYLWVGETSPIQKMAALRALHEAMAMELRELEYHESKYGHAQLRAVEHSGPGG